MTHNGIIATAQQHETCSVCGCAPGEACAGCAGTHLCRICLAADHGRITLADLASVMHDADVFTGKSVVLAGAA